MRSVLAWSMKLLGGIFIFLGLPLLAWGITDLRGFFSHPARLGYALLVVLLQVAVMVLVPGVGTKRAPVMKSVSQRKQSLLLLQAIPLAIVLAAPFGDRREIGTWAVLPVVRYFGLGFFCIGFGVMHWAEATLGRLFSIEVAIQENHRLITTGPFRHLRHPRYLGIIVFTAGIAIVFRSWQSLLLVLALTWVLLRRIRDEEALLFDHFSAEWEAYCEKSWRLIPFVY